MVAAGGTLRGGSATVEPGAALLLGNQLPSQASTISGGEDQFHGPLTLNGPGNTTLGQQYNLTGGPPLAPLTVVSDSTIPQLVHPTAPVLNAPTLAVGGGLTINQTYYYQVTAITASGETMASNYESATPLGLTSTGNQQTINLTWTAPPIAGITGYKVYRSLLTGPFTTPSLMATLPAGTTTYTDLGTTGPTAGSPPPPDALTPGDMHWAGPITLATSVAIDVQPGSRLTLAGVIDDAANAGPTGSDLVKIDTGDLVLEGANTYRGTTYIGTGAIYTATAPTGEAGKTVTVTVGSTAGLAVGQLVTLDGFTPAGYNGIFQITAINNVLNTFSFTAAAGLGAVTTLGTVSPYNPDIGGARVNTFFKSAAAGVVGSGSGGVVTVANSEALGQGAISEKQTLTTSAASGLFSLAFNGSTTAATLDLLRHPRRRHRECAEPAAVHQRHRGHGQRHQRRQRVHGGVPGQPGRL